MFFNALLFLSMNANAQVHVRWAFLAPTAKPLVIY
jgi:hypothetical protein